MFDITKQSYGERAIQVLIAEDDSDLLALISLKMEANGYEVITANNGQDAIVQAQNHSPDIIMLDICMPELDGLEAAKAIRQIPQMQNIPILMVTSIDDEATVHQAFDAGATEYITKPINWAVLCNRLEQLKKSILQDEMLRLAAMAIQNIKEGIMITNAKQEIMMINPAFTEITGYQIEECLGNNPRILQSGRHDSSFYKNLWQSLVINGFWQGEIWNKRKDGEVYPEWLNISALKNAKGEVIHYVGSFSNIATIKENEHRLEKLANYDALTGLANRHHFNERLSMTLAHSERFNFQFALFYIDLDDFKPVNDECGHDVGDDLLRAVASLLRNSVRKLDIVARLGGDEFCIVLINLHNTDSVEGIAKKVLAQFDQPIRIHGHKLSISCSIGISLYPKNAITADELLTKADQAMYLAKQSGKNRYTIAD